MPASESGIIGDMMELGIFPAPSRLLRHWVNKPAWSGFRSAVGVRKAVRLSQRTSVDDNSVLSLLLLLLRSAPVSIPGLAVRVKWVLEASKGRRVDRLRDLIDFLSDLTRQVQGENLDPKAFAWKYQVCSLIRKYPFLGNEDASKRAAIISFWQAEIHNLDTARRWTIEEDSGFLQTLTKRLDEFLGPCPTWEDIVDRGGFGPGTNEGYSFVGDLTGAEFKLATQPVCYAHNQALVPLVLNSVPGWAYTSELLHGNSWGTAASSTMFTVPKDAKTDRTAFKEPLIESFLQKGVASFIREGFMRDGRDLSYSWRTNHQLARLGSITDLWSTVDLKSASDSITRSMLISLFTTENLRKWFEMMDRIRSQQGVCLTDSKDGTRLHRFVLFSSMGNAYTFELESALFYCVLTSIVPGVWCGTGSARVLRWPHVSVFGDDLVFPTAYANRVVSTLEWLGFRVNSNKSFFDGSFRESCGRDFISGWDVRPLFITKRLEDGESVKTLANRIHNHSAMLRECPGSSRVFTMGEWKAVWTQVIGFLPPALVELNATPPGVPNGLWIGRWKVTDLGDNRRAWTWETVKGQSVGFSALDASTYPCYFRVLSVSSSSGTLRNMAFTSGPRGIAANGENLLQARLMPPTSNSWYNWMEGIETAGVAGEGFRRRQEVEIKVAWVSFSQLPDYRFPGFTDNLSELIPIESLVAR